MKNFLFILGMAFICEKIDTNGLMMSIRRCENDEVVCYVYVGGNRGGISCKFKENTDGKY